MGFRVDARSFLSGCLDLPGMIRVAVRLKRTSNSCFHFRAYRNPRGPMRKQNNAERSLSILAIEPPVPGRERAKFWNPTTRALRHIVVRRVEFPLHPNVNRRDGASTFGGASPNHSPWSPGGVRTYANRGTQLGRTGYIKN